MRQRVFDAGNSKISVNEFIGDGWRERINESVQ